MSSLQILRKVSALLAARGVHVTNVDASLIAEAPKIGPFVAEMRVKYRQGAWD
jgi:2C-methyl-D-erythritol 2,4-cyclodiphosphate synthase